jgi:nicotinate-nucleotide adenylyltransferase
MCEEMELEKVYLIPGALLPHKNRHPVTPFKDRLAMTILAVEESPSLEAFDLEGRRQGMSYSIETLREFHKLFKPGLELFFIIGSDAFLEINSWKEYKRLFDYSNFVVIKRPGFPLEELESFVFSLGSGLRPGEKKDTFIAPSGNLLIHKEASLMDISSTAIRRMVAEGRSIRFLVPGSVRSYILEKGLYTTHAKY